MQGHAPPLLAAVSLGRGAARVLVPSPQPVRAASPAVVVVPAPDLMLSLRRCGVSPFVGVAARRAERVAIRPRQIPLLAPPSSAFVPLALVKTFGEIRARARVGVPALVKPPARMARRVPASLREPALALPLAKRAEAVEPRPSEPPVATLLTPVLDGGSGANAYVTLF